MRVFVHWKELEEEGIGDEPIDMGEVADNMPLRELRERFLGIVAHRIPEPRREMSRHFWYNENFIPFRETRVIVGDVTKASAVVLYLRPDYYRIRMPNRQIRKFAVDPEISIRQVIDYCLEYEGASECYELTAPGSGALDPNRTLQDYRLLPYNRITDPQEIILTIRKKPTVVRIMIAIVAVLCIGGFLLGYLL